MSFPKVFTKDPADILDYMGSWASQMDADTDTIASSTWVLDTGLTEVSSSFTNTQTSIFVSGGDDGSEYDVTNRITTAGGRTYERSFTIRVRNL